jgi:hypothetical protein
MMQCGAIMFTRKEFEEVTREQLDRALKAGLQKGWRIADVTQAAAGNLKIAWYVDSALPSPVQNGATPAQSY